MIKYGAEIAQKLKEVFTVGRTLCRLGHHFDLLSVFVIGSYYHLLLKQQAKEL